MTDCLGGDAGTESCCASIEVPGGLGDSYNRNYGDNNTKATISNFRLDKYLVTVGRFRQFRAQFDADGGGLWTNVVAQGSGTHKHLNGGMGLVNDGTPPPAYEPGWVATDDTNVNPSDINLALYCGPNSPAFSTWTQTPGPNENLPINCVNWYEAYAFCIWDGGFLPSEAEWEYVAAGGHQMLLYPWGFAAPGTGSQYAIYNCCYPAGNCQPNGGCSTSSYAPVGYTSMGPALWGQYDMAGEVDEWIVDWGAGYNGPCTNCGDFTPPTAAMGGLKREDRGGNTGDGNVTYLYPTHDKADDPTTRSEYIGFRCARTP